ncbi:MAG: family 43 glycosylhydrolase [Bacteroidota bacterium]|nr:family 43 glycosylhydrolase [Bacteroidota bacterium]
MTKLTTTFLFLSLIATNCLAQQRQRPVRPVIFKTDTAFVHDPVMAYEDNVYYAFYTGLNIGTMKSSDRKTWTVYRDGVLKTIPAWTQDSVSGFKSHIWAPDVIKWNGRWWMAYSCSTFGKNTSAIGLLSASSLAKGDWKDEGCLVSSRGGRDQWNAIDANFVEDDCGNLWLTWGSFWDGIQFAPLKEVKNGNGDATLRLAAQPRTIGRRYGNNAPVDAVNPTSKYAGVNAIEAPFIIKNGGYYYLFVSWDYCCRGMQSSYRVVVGRSETVGGPYFDKEGIAMTEGGGTPVIEGDKKEFEAAGHSAAYHFPDGDLFICHGYSMALNGQSVLIQKSIKWVDGWPVLQ